MSSDDVEGVKRALDAETIRILETRARTKRRWRTKRPDEPKSAEEKEKDRGS